MALMNAPRAVPVEDSVSLLRAALIASVAASPRQPVGPLLLAAAVALGQVTSPCQRALLSSVASAFGDTWGPHGGFPPSLAPLLPEWWPLSEWHGTAPGDSRRYAAAAIIILTGTPATALHAVARLATGCEAEGEPALPSAAPLLTAVLRHADTRMMSALAPLIAATFPCEALFSGYALLTPDAPS